MLTLCLLALHPTPQDDGLDQRWIAFERDRGRVIAEGPLVDADHEADLAWGDLDQNGRDDLVIARKEPFMTVGGRANVLLMNEDGRLVDRTASHASAADLDGDRGFLTPTNDRDVAIADLTGDGWLDVVTAVDQTPDAPKHLGHPRVTVNLGSDDEGAWRGLRFEDARFPQLAHLDSGDPVDAHFMTVAVGDVDGDGDLDLYFGDCDAKPNTGEEWPPPMEEPGEDADDRLLVNDGSGHFTDASATHAAREVLDARFCNAVVFADLNGDDRLDLVKQSSYSRPNTVFAAYGGAGDARGTFPSKAPIYEGRPYFVSTGDLNNDGRVDLVVSENGLDCALFNRGNGDDGTAQWSDPTPFTFLWGEDDKYAGDSRIVDLDGDGWSDVLITDVDPEIPTYDRRAHLYHNRGAARGSADVVLREERESAADEGWVGAVGLTAADWTGTHDFAPIDVDGDGALDLVLARKDGLDVWIQSRD